MKARDSDGFDAQARRRRKDGACARMPMLSQKSCAASNCCLIFFAISLDAPPLERAPIAATASIAVHQGRGNLATRATPDAELPPIRKIDSHMREIANRFAPGTSVLVTCTVGAALCLLLGCVASPPESPPQQQADEAVASRVFAALESDRMHLYIGLDVRVHAGVAYITALTFDPSVRDQATEIARAVRGVTRVVNRVEVAAGAAP